MAESSFDLRRPDARTAVTSGRRRASLHPDAICEFPANTYRGAASFRKGLDDFAGIMNSIEVIRLVVDGEHCVAIMNIDTVFGVIPFAEHIQVVNGQIVSIRGYCDPRPMLAGAKMFT
jgi:hypothetical protein